MASKKFASVYQVKATLDYIRPPIWRRFQVPSHITLYDLHRVLQVVMGWEDAHLHQFIIQGQFFGLPEDDILDDEIVDERKVTLNQILVQEKMKFKYEYDFGDSWSHTILVEKILEPEKGVLYPVCLKGKRNCPPEDCGGAPGYDYLLEVLKKPESKEYKQYKEWLGEPFDSEEFDLQEINKALKKIRKKIS